MGEEGTGYRMQEVRLEPASSDILEARLSLTKNGEKNYALTFLSTCFCSLGAGLD